VPARGRCVEIPLYIRFVAIAANGDLDATGRRAVEDFQMSDASAGCCERFVQSID
jgi:hypothetical protein